MSSGQKAAFSFLAALVFFAGFVFFAHTGLMAQIETKFYAQAKIGEKSGQLEKLSESCNSYITDILTKIQTGDKAYLKSSAVKTYVHQNPSEKDATERKNLTAQLFDELDAYGLEGIRLIEKNGRTLHYSSYESDVLKRVSLNTTYKLYSDIVKDSSEIESDVLLVDADKPQTRFLLDKTANRIILCFPFYITDNTYFATLVCYFGVHQFEQNLLNENIIRLGDSLCIATAEDSYTGGFVLNLPSDSRSEFYNPILSFWKKNQKNQNFSFERILEKNDGSYWLLMTASQGEYFNVSAVYSSTLFELPREMEYLIYTCVFITLLLVASLAFNLKRDYLTIIKTRIKKVQFGIINEYLENKEKIEWSQIARQLENRKAELSEEIKKAVGGKSNKYSKQVDAYLDSSWEDIISILKAQNGVEHQESGGASIEEIRSVIEEVLRTSKLNVNVTNTAVTPTSIPVADEVEEVEEIEELAIPEALEGSEEAEPLEEIEEAEPLEDVEEIEEAEPLEEVEEVEEIEEAEPLEDVEEIEEAEPLEEVEEVEEIEEVEPLEEAEPVEEVEELEELAVPEALEGPEEAETLEEVEEAELLEEVEEAEEAIEEISAEKMFGPNQAVEELKEELFIGEPSNNLEQEETFEPFDFQVIIPHFEIPQLPVQQPEEVEEIDDAEIIDELPYFSMTSFAQHEEPVVELKAENEDNDSNQDTIIQTNGVYSISDNLPYTKVLLNKEFKALVDSVLHE